VLFLHSVGALFWSHRPSDNTHALPTTPKPCNAEGVGYEWCVWNEQKIHGAIGVAICYLPLPRQGRCGWTCTLKTQDITLLINKLLFFPSKQNRGTAAPVRGRWQSTAGWSSRIARKPCASIDTRRAAWGGLPRPHPQKGRFWPLTTVCSGRLVSVVCEIQNSH
jgi:hypothetical protein